jgi:glutathione-specific gamma-glutamylcyclotransferase
MPDQLWVFGYGSLIWDPCFTFDRREVATAYDWHRSFCMWSVHYRGTVEEPGLVLALDRAEGAACQGVAFAIPVGDEAATVEALRVRELISSAYLEEVIEITLPDGRVVPALTYVINRNHAQYTGVMTLDAQAEVIATRHGVRGPNRDYLFATAAHLAELGLTDPEMEQLVTMVRALP